MKVEWLDVVKLTVPFLTAIAMIWIKGWVETHLARKNKQHALSRLIDDDLQSLYQSIRMLRRIAESAALGALRLVSIDISSLISKLANDLSELDASQAYAYAELVSAIEIVNKGLVRLNALVLSRVAAREPSVESLIDRVIIGQSKITAVDYMSLAKVYFKVIEIIPERRRSMNAQAVNALHKQSDAASKEIDDWPAAPTILNDAKPVSSLPEQIEPRA